MWMQGSGYLGTLRPCLPSISLSSPNCVSIASRLRVVSRLLSSYSWGKFGMLSLICLPPAPPPLLSLCHPLCLPPCLPLYLPLCLSLCLSLCSQAAVCHYVSHFVSYFVSHFVFDYVAQLVIHFVPTVSLSPSMSPTLSLPSCLPLCLALVFYFVSGCVSPYVSHSARQNVAQTCPNMDARETSHLKFDALLLGWKSGLISIHCM